MTNGEDSKQEQPLQVTPTASGVAKPSDPISSGATDKRRDGVIGTHWIERIRLWDVLGVIIAGCALLVGTCSIVADGRAWIAFEKIEFEPGVARVYIKNYGNGPALSVTTRVRADSAKPQAVPAIKRNDPTQSVGVMAPEQSNNLPVGISDVCETCTAYVTGRVSYEDQFGFDRETTFCVFAHARDRSLNAAAICDDLNYAD